MTNKYNEQQLQQVAPSCMLYPYYGVNIKFDSEHGKTNYIKITEEQFRAIAAILNEVL